MEFIVRKIFEQLIFWMAWIIIPLFMEIIPAFGGFLILVKKHFTGKAEQTPIRYPEITLIVPVYNSESTLEECLSSIQASDYPKELIHIMLVNNQSTDDSFAVFCSCQIKYPKLSMQWLKARQGKSKALNLALFNSQGKYIIHIDSDGKLNPKAIKNMVERFEAKPKIDCLTGVILTDPKMIEDTKSFPMRLLRRCEFLEYCQAFLAGRNFESELNSIYTLSGAFSAFRKSTILKTQMYNTDTVCEDTQVTFQVRRHMKKNVLLCENAFFFVDPIESPEKLYTQRQRWQTGELEVSHMFLQNGLKSKSFFSDFMVRQLTYDHTFAFPRMIWYFALICLMFLNYPLSLVAGSVVFLYLLYVFSAFLFYLNIISYLKGYRDLRKYYIRKWYILPLMPFYNFIGFWIRFAAIINSIKNRNGWKASTLSEEKQRFISVIGRDFHMVSKIIRKMRTLVNNV